MKTYTTCRVCNGLLLAVTENGRWSDVHPDCSGLHPTPGMPGRQTYLNELERKFLAAVRAGETRTADSLAETLDRASQAPESLLDAAKLYVSWGWPVFPLRPGDKTPATKNGFHDASLDPQRWAVGPVYNIGIPTGVMFDVIDVDYRANPQALDVWLQIADQFEVDAVVATPHGTHYYVQSTGSGNRAEIRGVKGFDYRGKGGYVVAPPSRRPDGTYWWRSEPSPRIKQEWNQGAYERQAMRDMKRRGDSE